MKRLLAILFLAQSYYVCTSYVHAEQITSGYIGLIQPSISTPDRNRSSGDKLNSNFQMISTSMQVLSDNLNTSTQTIQNEINFISTSKSTGDATLSSLVTSFSSNSTLMGGSTSYVIASGDTTTVKGGITIKGNLIIGSTLTSNANSRLAVVSGAGATLPPSASQLFLQNNLTGSADVNLQMIAGTAGNVNLNFGDDDNPVVGQINYSHSANHMNITANNINSGFFSSTEFQVPGIVTADTYTFRTNGGFISSTFPVLVDKNMGTFSTFMSSSDAQQTKFVNFFSTSDTHQNTALNFFSTAGAQTFALNNFLSTHSTHQDATLNFLSTGSAQIYALNNFLTTGTVKMDALSVDTTTLRSRLNAVATDTTTLKTVNSNIATDTTTLSTKPGPIVSFDEGVVVGTISSINCVGSGIACTGAGSTLTVTVAGASGGTTLRNYQYYVGTAGAQGVDTIVTNLNNFNLLLASAGAMGLTYYSSGTMDIFWGNGLYDITGATNPNGANWICGSSTVFYTSQVNQTMITNYGAIGDPRGSPCYVSGAGLAFSSKLFAAKSNSVNNITLIDGDGQADVNGLVFPSRKHFFGIESSTNVRGNLWFKNYTLPVGNQSAHRIGCVTMAIYDSIDVNLNIRNSSPTIRGGSAVGRTFLSIASSTRTLITFDSDGVGSPWVELAGNTRLPVIRGRMRVPDGAPAQTGDFGIIYADYARAYPSSGTIIGPLDVDVYGPWAGHIIKGGSSGATVTRTFAMTIKDLIAKCYDPTNAAVVILTNNDMVNMNVSGMHIFGCTTAITDTSTASKWQFWKDGVYSAN